MKKFTPIGFPALLILILLMGCSKSDDQKDFENHAFSNPSNITETTADANADPVNVDPDDWRISPMYQGIISFNTIPYPNPVLTNQDLNFDLYISTQSVSRIDIFVFREGTQPRPIDFADVSNTQTGFVTFRINSQNFAASGAPTGLFRIVLLDGQNDVISYGDVQVNQTN